MADLTRKPTIPLMAENLIFPSIDVETLDEAKRLMDQFEGLVTHVKIGLQLATQESWSACIAAAHERGLEIFCDTKFKDIPNTVQHATMSLCNHGPEFFTVMADNSLEAMKAARLGVDTALHNGVTNRKPKIIGVTVLTSIDDAESQVIYGADTKTKVMQFGERALQAGFDAIVCSPQELSLFRADPKFDQIMLISPGVRPAWAAADDQSRIMTPAKAIAAGADMLVIGRPITQPPADIGTPAEAIKRIIAEIEEALA